MARSLSVYLKKTITPLSNFQIMKILSFKKQIRVTHAIVVLNKSDYSEGMMSIFNDTSKVKSK